VVVHAYAIVDPLAVMVELWYTFVTNVTMSRISCTCNLTLRTQQIRIKFFN